MPRTGSTSDDAYRRIREEIVLGRLWPGETVVENRLGEALGMSRTPVREALLRLEREGLLERKGRSLSVRVFSLDDIADIFGLRAHIESYAARLAAGRIVLHELLELQRAHGLMIDAVDRYERAPQRDTLRDVTQLNRRFHQIVVNAARSPALAHAIAHAVQVPLLFRAQEWYAPEDRRELAEEHGRLVELLRAGDADGAEAFWRDHLLRARDKLVLRLAAAELEREASVLG